jgi:hypothetical protein
MHISSVYQYALFICLHAYDPNITAGISPILPSNIRAKREKGMCPSVLIHNAPGQSEIIIASITAVSARRLSTTWAVTYKISAPRLGKLHPKRKTIRSLPQMGIKLKNIV